MTFYAKKSQLRLSIINRDGVNGPFTETLLEYIEEPGLEIRDVLTKVRMRAMKKTNK